MSNPLPCPRCLALAKKGKIRIEMVQPLPEGALAPMGFNQKKCCYDCQAADNLTRDPAIPGFEAARICIGNDRQAQYRLPEVPLGLVKDGRMRPSKRGDLEKHHAWLRENNWFGCEEGKDL